MIDKSKHKKLCSLNCLLFYFCFRMSVFLRSQLWKIFPLTEIPFQSASRRFHSVRTAVTFITTYWFTMLLAAIAAGADFKACQQIAKRMKSIYVCAEDSCAISHMWLLPSRSLFSTVIRLKWTWGSRVCSLGAEFPHWLSYITVASCSSSSVSLFFFFLFLPFFLMSHSVLF